MNNEITCNQNFTVTLFAINKMPNGCIHQQTKKATNSTELTNEHRRKTTIKSHTPPSTPFLILINSGAFYDRRQEEEEKVI
jgi:hypothetical protein